MKEANPFLVFINNIQKQIMSQGLDMSVRQYLKHDLQITLTKLNEKNFKH